MQRIFSKLSSIDAGIVLDAATGRGEFIPVIKQNFRSFVHITGIDNNQKNVDYAQKMFPENNIEIYKMDLEKLDYEDGHFDTITISNSLHHLQHLDLVLKELLRVLKKGGCLIVTEMFKDGIQTPPQETHILFHHWLARFDMLSGNYHAITFDRQEIIDLIRALPVKIVSVDDFYYPVDNPKEIKNCENLIKNCQEVQKRLSTMEGVDELISEGETLRRRVIEIGCASASRLLIISKKK
ncbi:MAG: class I SAM-dependent methyltransferase [Candidatus Cloacimonetes bacterium]|nr:class I SAM-dependent methyltransferase [Candidatus Cloacimonadota bacterium]